MPEVCKTAPGMPGYDDIRNRSREQLRASGYVLCRAPDPDNGVEPAHPENWELWAHPTHGLLHFKVNRTDSCPQLYFCIGQSKDAESCFQCCDKAVPAEDERCRKGCDSECVKKYLH